jgi:hypothetical protein
MHRIALIRFHQNYGEYESYDRVITSITDWTEVDEKELKLLKDHAHIHDFVVIEHLPDSYVHQTVADVLALVKKAEEDRERRRLERLAQQAANIEKRAAKELEKKKLLQKLKKDLGE